MELPLTHPEYYEDMGIKPPKGVILYGAPGTGEVWGSWEGEREGEGEVTQKEAMHNKAAVVENKFSRNY